MSNEDEDDGSVAQGRYPCIPSLVALQQMKNRLHLAQLGKKLMKWTTLATGRELRVISKQLGVAYDGFKGEMVEGFIMLARSRYFVPFMNRSALEDVPNDACVTIEKTMKSVSGVKIFQYHVVELSNDAYPLMGVGKGGEMITDTKKFWRKILIKVISIAQLRVGFHIVDEANKSATKRMNVLGKMVIPKTMATVSFIKLEMEEIAREELFRIKKVVQTKEKRRRKKKSEKSEELEPIISESLLSEKLKEPSEIGSEPIISESLLSEKLKESSEVGSEPIISESLLSEKFKESSEVGSQDSSPTSSSKKLKLKKAPKPTSKSSLECKCSSRECSNKTLTPKESREVCSGKSSIGTLEPFLLACQKFRQKLEQYKRSGKTVPPEIKAKLISQLQEAINLCNEVKAMGPAPCGLDNFIESCEDIKKLLSDSKDSNEQKLDINDLVDLVDKLKQEGLVTDSAADFVNTCAPKNKQLMASKTSSDPNRTEGILPDTSCYSSPKRKSVTIVKKHSCINTKGNKPEQLSKRKDPIDVNSKESESGFTSKASKKPLLIPRSASYNEPMSDKCAICNSPASAPDLESEQLSKSHSKESSNKKVTESEKLSKLKHSKKSNDSASESTGKIKCKFCKKPVFIPRSGSNGKCSCNSSASAPDALSERGKVIICPKKEIPGKRSKYALKNQSAQSSGPCTPKTCHSFVSSSSKASSSPASEGEGLFENKSRKIVKITRYKNEDGTIREEKEIITIKTNKFDPNKKALDDALNISDDESEFEEKSCYYTCQSPHEPSPFMAKAYSEPSLVNRQTFVYSILPRISESQRFGRFQNLTEILKKLIA